MDSRAQNNIQDLVLKGTASIPGIAFLGNVSTGIYSPGTDEIAIATGGVGALAIDASQNVTLANPLEPTEGGTGLAAYTTGDLLYASATDTISRLPVGTNNYVLTVASGVPAWTAAAASGVASVSFGSTGLTPNTATTGAISVAGTLVSGFGGTGFSTYAKGDILYASAINTVSKLPVGSTGQVLTVSAGAPVWATAAASGVSSLATSVAANATGFGLAANVSTGAVTLTFSISTASSARTSLGLGSTDNVTFNKVTASSGASLGFVVGNAGVSYASGFGNLNMEANTSFYGNTSSCFHSVNSVTNWSSTNTTFTLGSGISAFKDGGGTWSATSDLRVKKDITPYPLSTKDLLTLNPVSYKYNGQYGTNDSDASYIGLIAQEVQNTPFVSMVNSYDRDGVEILSVDSSQLVFALINAVKELTARIKVLEAKAP